MISADKVWALCKEVGYAIRNSNDPVDHVAAYNAARLLFMTAAHESDNFKARRQYGFSSTSDRGAFSLFQMEWPSIVDSGKHISNPSRSILLRHCTEFLEERINNGFHVGWLTNPLEHKTRILSKLQTEEGDPLACVYARLHYLRVPAALPKSAKAMAEYAKKYYNTSAGKATPMDYLGAYAEWIDKT